MQKYIYSACFLAGVPLIAQGINQEAKQDVDFVVLQDGSKITGSLTHFPPMSFQFGKVPLKMSEIASIAFSYQGTSRKMEITTQEGFKYVADAPKENFVILRYIPDQENAKYTIQKEINPSLISYIVLKPRNYTPTHLSRKAYEVELKNGDRIPVVLGRNPLLLSTGLNDGTINPDEIVELTVDNGIYGTLKNRKGVESEFDYAFAKDKLLHVQVLKSHEMLGLEWDQINKIQRVDYANEGLALKVPDFEEESQEIAHHEVKIVKTVDVARLTRLKEENQQLIDRMEALKSENFRLAQYAQAVEESALIAELGREILTPINQAEGVLFLSGVLNEKEERIQQLESLATEEVLTLKEDLQKECDRSSELEVFLKDAIADATKYQQQICSLADELEAKGKNFESSDQERVERLSELEGEIGKLRNQYLVAMDSTVSYENMINELQGKLTIEKSHVQEVEEILSLFAGETSTYKGEIADLKEVLKGKDQLIDKFQANNEAEQYRKKVVELEDQLSFVNAFEEKRNGEKENLSQEQTLRRSLEQNLSQMAFQVEEYEEQIESIQASLMKKEQQFETVVSGFEEKLENKTVELADLYRNKAELEERILASQQEANNENQEFSKQIEDSRLTITQLEATIANTQQKLHKRSVQLADLTDAQSNVLDMLDEDSAAWVSEREELTSRLEESQTSIVQLEAAIASTQEQLHKRSVQLADLTDTQSNVLDMLDEDSAAWMNEREGLTSQLKESQSSKAQLETMIANTQEELSHKSIELANLIETQTQVQDLMDENHSVWASEKEILTFQLEESRSSSGQLEATIASMQEELTNKSVELVTLTETQAQVLERMDEDNVAWSGEREAMTFQLEESQSNIAQLEATIANAQEELSHKSIELANLIETQTQIQDLMNENSSVWASEKKALSFQLEESQSGIAQLESNIAYFEQQLENKEQQNDEKVQEISSLRQEVSDTALTVGELQQEVYAWEQKQAEIEELATRYETESSEKNESLTSAREQISELVTTNTQIQNEIQMLQQERELFEEKLSLEKEKNKEKDEQVESLNQSLKTQRKALARIESSHSELLSKLEERKSQGAPSISLIAENRNQTVKVRNSFTPFRQVHSVGDGESLRSISTKYYGTPNRWSDLYEANRDIIKDVDQINVGTTLVIP